MNRPRRRTLLALLLTVGFAVASTNLPASARPAVAVDVSGASPYAPNGCRVDASLQGLEVEPSLAVNPTDRRNIVVAWMQDNAVAIAAAATLDGGATWHRLVVPRLTTCSGGKLDHVYDPRLVFGPDGVVHLTAIEQGAHRRCPPRCMWLCSSWCRVSRYRLLDR
jgi:hypothetical protein